MKEKFGYSKYFRNIQIFFDILFVNFFYLFVLKHIGFNDIFSIRVILDFNLLWFLSVLIVNPYQVYRYSGYFKLLRKQVLVVLTFIFLISLFISFFFGESIYGIIRYVKILASFFTLYLLWKLIIIFLIIQYRKHGGNIRRYSVIGSGIIVQDFNKELRANKSLGYKFLGNINVTKKDSKSKILSLINSSSIIDDSDIVYISLPSIKYSYLTELVSILESKRKFVRVILDFKSSMARHGELEFVDYIPVLNFVSDPLDSISLSVKKRVFDIIFAISSIIFLLPFFLIFSIITFLTSKGPVFYRQERIGIKGKIFEIYKYRSMYIDAEKSGPALSKNEDPRITPWGKIMRKYRIDELPQFFNVLFGSMSVVGPRPEREYWKNEIIKESPQFNRLAFVKPGITSIGQVKYGYAENVEEMRKRLRYDLLYLNNMSIWTDIKIIFMTIMVIIKGEGK